MLLAWAIRRLLLSEAEVSSIGAGGIGAASSLPPSITVPPLQPQAGAAAAHPQVAFAAHPQPLLQLPLQQRKRLSSNPTRQRDLQQLFAAHPQEAFAAHPQAGAAAAQPQVAFAAQPELHPHRDLQQRFLQQRVLQQLFAAQPQEAFAAHPQVAFAAQPESQPQRDLQHRFLQQRVLQQLFAAQPHEAFASQPQGFSQHDADGAAQPQPSPSI